MMRCFAIVPAAGRSRRMGRQHKLLLPWGNATILDAVLQAWQASCVTQIVVVARADDLQVHRIVRSYAKTSLLLPQPPPAEMRHSVEAALRWIDAHCHPEAEDRWLLAPADMPQISSRLIDQLAQHASTGEPAIVEPWDGKRAGHPIAVPWQFAAKVFELPSNVGVNALKQLVPVQRLHVDADALASDIDTPDDYRRTDQSGMC